MTVATSEGGMSTKSRSPRGRTTTSGESTMRTIRSFSPLWPVSLRSFTRPSRIAFHKALLIMLRECRPTLCRPAPFTNTRQSRSTLIGPSTPTISTNPGMRSAGRAPAGSGSRPDSLQPLNEVSARSRSSAFGASVGPRYRAWLVACGGLSFASLGLSGSSGISLPAWIL
jgi:hypothetical protein